MAAGGGDPAFLCAEWDDGCEVSARVPMEEFYDCPGVAELAVSWGTGLLRGGGAGVPNFARVAEGGGVGPAAGVVHGGGRGRGSLGVAWQVEDAHEERSRGPEMVRSREERAGTTSSLAGRRLSKVGQRSSSSAAWWRRARVCEREQGGGKGLEGER